MVDSSSDLPLTGADAAPALTGCFVTAADGTRLWVERCGAGAPLVLVPGLGAGNWLWQGLLPRLARHCELIMPELRGSGRSDKPDARYSVEKFSSDILAVLDALGIQQCDLVGASLGGYVAQCFAACWPARVRKLVLVATSLGGSAQTGPAGDVLARLIRPHGRNRRERLEDAYALGFSDAFRRTHRDVLDRITDWRLAHPQPEFAYYRQLLAGNAWEGELLAPRIPAPALVCAGQDDPVVPLHDARALAAALRDATLVVVPGRHLFLIEHAAELAQSIASFFEEEWR
jgi:pimeloyl-ACP methyl ester carboxylesterase